VALDVLSRMIDEDTFLISCMLANNEIGTILDVRAIAEIAKQHNVLIFSDCVQALGKIPIDIHQLGINYASFSAHKIYGPKGVGALFVKQGSPFIPWMHGGHQEHGMRAGTEATHNIAGFGTACSDVEKKIDKMVQVGRLKQLFVEKIKEIKPDCTFNSPDTNCLSNTVSVTFPNTNNLRLMAMLNAHGIAVSGGSACSAREKKQSHVLLAIGLSEQSAHETIRVSLGCQSSERDILYTIKVLKDYLWIGE
jgi:cysteine desulfurase